MTAAATTGPNNDPRPTSSTPATSFAPDAQAFFSNPVVQRSRLSRRIFSAALERVPDFGLAGTELASIIYESRAGLQVWKNGEAWGRASARPPESNRFRAGGRLCRGARAGNRAWRGARAQNAGHQSCQ